MSGVSTSTLSGFVRLRLMTDFVLPQPPMKNSTIGSSSAALAVKHMWASFGARTRNWAKPLFARWNWYSSLSSVLHSEKNK